MDDIPPPCTFGHPNCKDVGHWPAPDPAKAGICARCKKPAAKLWESPRFGWFCAPCLKRAIRIANWQPPGSSKTP